MSKEIVEKKDKKIIKEKDRIATPEKVMEIFIEQSTGSLIKQKNNEHIGVANSENVREWMIEDLGNILDGMKDQLTGDKQQEMKDLIKILRKDLPKYVENLDETMTRARNDYLVENVKVEPDGIVRDPTVLDNALIKVTVQSDFTKVKQNMVEMPGSKKYYVWKKASKLFENAGCIETASFCGKQKKNAISEVVNQEVSKERKVILGDVFKIQLNDNAVVAMTDIRTPQEFVGVFIEQSAIFYNEKKRLSKEKPDEIKKEIKDFLNKNLLGAMSHKPDFDKEEAEKLVELFRNNMDSYVNALASSKDNKFINAGRRLQGIDLKDRKDTNWAKLSEICKKIGLPDKIINYFDKKNEQAKEKALDQSIETISKKLGTKGLVLDKKGAVKNTPNKAKKSKEIGK